MITFIWLTCSNIQIKVVLHIYFSLRIQTCNTDIGLIQNGGFKNEWMDWNSQGGFKHRYSRLKQENIGLKHWQSGLKQICWTDRWTLLDEKRTLWSESWTRWAKEGTRWTEESTGRAKYGHGWQRHTRMEWNTDAMNWNRQERRETWTN